MDIASYGVRTLTVLHVLAITGFQILICLFLYTKKAEMSPSIKQGLQDAITTLVDFYASSNRTETTVNKVEIASENVKSAGDYVALIYVFGRWK